MSADSKKRARIRFRFLIYAFMTRSGDMVITATIFFVGLGFGSLQSIFLVNIQYYSTTDKLVSATSVAQMTRKLGAFAGSFIAGKNPHFVMQLGSDLAAGSDGRSIAPGHLMTYAVSPAIGMLVPAFVGVVMMSKIKIEDEAGFARVGITS